MNKLYKKFVIIKKEQLVLFLIFLILLFRFAFKGFFGDSIDPLDFHVLYETAKSYLNGQTNLYHLAYGGGMYFKYAPFSILLCIPWGFLPYKLSIVIWLVLHAVFFIMSLWIMRLIFDYYKITLHPLLYLCGLVSIIKAVTIVFNAGQVDILIFLLVLLSIYAHLHGKNIISSLMLALAFSIKLPALIFIIFFILRKDIRSVFFTLAWIILLNTFASFIIHPSVPFDILYQWSLAPSAHISQHLMNPHNQALQALFIRYFSNDPYGINILSFSLESIHYIIYVLRLILMTSMIVLWGLYRRHPYVDLFVLGALFIFMVLFPSVTWLANYVVLLFPVLLILNLFPLIFIQRKFIGISLCLMGLLLNLFTNKKMWILLGINFDYKNNLLIYIFEIWPMFGIMLYIILMYMIKELGRTIKDESIYLQKG